MIFALTWCIPGVFSWCAFSLVLNFLRVSPMYFNSQLWHVIAYTMSQVFSVSTLALGSLSVLVRQVKDAIRISQSPQVMNLDNGTNFWDNGRISSKCIHHSPLMFSTQGKKSADDILIFFFLFFPESGLDISCQETVSLKCKVLYSEEDNKKTISKCLLLKFYPAC